MRPVRAAEASPEVADALGEHFCGLVAHSTAGLESVAAQLRAAAGSRLTPRMRQAIALRVSELNGCAGPSDALPLDAATTHGYRKGLADAPKEQALLAFATKLVLERGHHTRCAVEAARQLGVEDAEIVDVVALVGLHTFANYLESVAG